MTLDAAGAGLRAAPGAARGPAPAVSVVVATRNRRGFLEQAVASVRAQSFRAWELIVVDDASTDGTRAFLEELAAGAGRVRALSLDRHGERGKARNAGLALARGRHVLFLDDDDLLPERALEQHVGALDAAPGAIASIGGYVTFDARGTTRTVRTVSRRVLRGIWTDVLFGWMATFGQSLCRTECVRAAGGWSESYVKMEDHEFWLRLGRLGPVVLLPEITLRYRIHDGQWAPPDLETLMTEVREIAARRLDGRARRRADHVMAARRLVGAAQAHRWRGEGLAACALYGRALATAPVLLASPLTRPMMLRPMLRSAAGVVARAVRRGAAAGRARPGRVAPAGRGEGPARERLGPGPDR